MAVMTPGALRSVTPRLRCPPSSDLRCTPTTQPAGYLTDSWPNDTDLCMKTTLDFDERLLREAKMRAAAEGSTLTGLIERALRSYLRPPPAKRTRFRLRLLTKRGRIVPGVNWDDRDSLYERMEGSS